MNNMTEISEVMTWVEVLPEVGDPILNERKAIVALLEESNRIEKLAAELRGKAYHKALALESRILGLWPTEQIAAARARGR